MKPASPLTDLPDGSFAAALPATAAETNAGAARWSDYLELTKPRMNALVVITTAVGYYMAARVSADWARLLHTIIGTALTAAGASVLNQYLERDLDTNMPRTANRPLP